MDFLSSYGLFLAKTLTAVIAFLFVLLCTLALTSKGKDKSKGKINFEAYQAYYNANDSSHTSSSFL